MIRLNVGCGRDVRPGWINVDREPGPGVDLVADLDLSLLNETALRTLPDNHADEIELSHVIEHLHRPLDAMEELHRIAKPGAKLTIKVPHGASDDAWEDPTHRRPYFPRSFLYFGQPMYWRADYGYRGDWRVVAVQMIVREDARKRLAAMTPAAITIAIERDRNLFDEMIATLAAMKPIREMRRELIEPLQVTIS